MPRSLVRLAGALAMAAGLAALVVGGSGASASGAPSRDPCVTRPSKSKPHAAAVAAVVTSKPTVVTLRTLPRSKPSTPSGGEPRDVPQPSYGRAQKLKPTRTKANCVPHATQIISAAPAKP